MLKLFDRLFKPTNLSSKLVIDVKIVRDDSFYKKKCNELNLYNTYKTCSNSEDFCTVYEEIKKDIRIQTEGLNIKSNLLPLNDQIHGLRYEIDKIKISLSGKLRGKKFNRVFENLDSYYNFLENNSLIIQQLESTLAYK